MRRNIHVLAHSLLCTLACASVASRVFAGGEVWSQASDFQDAWGPSQIGGGEYGGVNAEVADDFNLQGAINEIRVTGYRGGQGANPPFTGLFVRFYAFGEDNRPGALQREYFLAAGDPNLVVLTASNPSNFNVTLSSPFVATGQHFVSVQVQMDVVFSSRWYWYSANTDNPSGEAIYLRNPHIGVNEWSHDVWMAGFNGSPPFVFETANSDVAFRLFGSASPAVPPAIESVLGPDSVAAAPLGDRLVILGNDFGAQIGQVLIGGVPAAVSAWDNLRITAYPRDNTPTGATTVQIINAGGESNLVPVVISPRPDPDGAGRARWRFRADDLYIESRPVVGPDGTVYAAGIGGRLYALEPDGGVKWIFQTYPPTCYQPLDVGPDGAIYMAAGATVFAINPDGTERWRITDPDFDSVRSGPTVGPDGNIYGLTTDNANGGWGAFSLTPAGTLRWNTPGFFSPNGAPHGRAMVFDAFNHVWTSTPGIGPGQDSFYAFDRDSGAITFSRDGAFLQPAVSPAGDRIYGAIYDPFSPPNLVALDPEGNEIFSVLSNTVATGLDVGIDGNIYVGINAVSSDSVASVSPAGDIRWMMDLPGENFRYDPVISPANQVVATPVYRPMTTGFVVGQAPENGGVLWTLELPFENDGFVWPFYRMRFAPDGQTVYLGTTHNNYLPDPYSYLYAIDASVPNDIVPGDATHDGQVDVDDLLAVITGWGVCPALPALCPADLSHDGTVDVDDLLLVIINWG